MTPRKHDGAMLDNARQVAAQLKPAAEKAKPYARSAGHAARRQLLKTRAWAAPQVERSGRALQDTVAPKAAAMLQDTVAPKAAAVLSEAAKRIDPAQPRQRNWPKAMSLVLASLTAAFGGIAAWLRARSKPSGQPGEITAATATRPVTMPNGQAAHSSTSADTPH